MTSYYQRGELVKYGICVVGDVTRVRLKRLHRLSNLWRLQAMLCRQNIHQGPWKLCASVCLCVNVQAAKRHDTALSHSQSAVQLNNSLCTGCATLSLHFAAGNAHSTATVQRSLTLFSASLNRSLSLSGNAVFCLSSLQNFDGVIHNSACRLHTYSCCEHTFIKNLLNQ